MEKTKTKVMNRKGQVDLFYIIAGMFAISITIFAVYMMLDKINLSGIYDDYSDAKQVHALGTLSILNFDNTMLFIIIGLSLFVIISAAFVWNHPAYIVLGLVLLAIAITVAGTISNSWMAFTDNAAINPLTATYPKIHFLMQQLPYYIFFMGIVSLIAMALGYKREFV